MNDAEITMWEDKNFQSKFVGIKMSSTCSIRWACTEWSRKSVRGTSSICDTCHMKGMCRMLHTASICGTRSIHGTYSLQDTSSTRDRYSIHDMGKRSIYSMQNICSTRIKYSIRDKDEALTAPTADKARIIWGTSYIKPSIQGTLMKWTVTIRSTLGVYRKSSIRSTLSVRFHTGKNITRGTITRNC